jgi:hypothetical protein
VQYFTHSTSPTALVPTDSQFASYCVNLPQKGLPCIQAAEHQAAARSRRAGGVNDGTFADGSVGFITNNINLATWRAYSTSQGGEIVSEAEQKTYPKGIAVLPLRTARMPPRVLTVFRCLGLHGGTGR